MESLKNDLMLLPQLKNPLAAAERALTFMHEQGIIELQQGLAVFRQSMTIRLNSRISWKKVYGKRFFPLGNALFRTEFSDPCDERVRQAGSGQTRCGDAVGGIVFQ